MLLRIHTVAAGSGRTHYVTQQSRASATILTLRHRNEGNRSQRRGTNRGPRALEVSSTTTRLILDCGWPIEAQTDEVLPPQVPGLFAAGIAPHAVLLSHAHPDHTGFIEQIAANVPIFATADASKIMKVGKYLRPRSVDFTGPISGGECASQLARASPAICPWRSAHHRLSSGPLLDGCSRLPRRACWAANLLHGRFAVPRAQARDAKRILKNLRGKLDLLITEGTNVGREQSGLSSEKEVENRAIRLSRRCASLVMVAYSPQNLDRFVSFFRASVKAGEDLRLRSLPSCRAISAQQFRAAAAIAQRTSHLSTAQAEASKACEKRFGDSTINLDEILATPDRFMMLMRPSMILNDLAGRLPPETRSALWNVVRLPEQIGVAGRLSSCLHYLAAK